MLDLAAKIALCIVLGAVECAVVLLAFLGIAWCLCMFLGWLP